MGVVVFGASGHAKVVIDALWSTGQEVVGIVDDAHPPGAGPLDVPVLGGRDALAELLQDDRVAGVVIGIGDNAARARVTEALIEQFPAIAFPTVIHASAAVAPSATVGPGSVVLAGAVVQPACQVGRGCIVNTRASLDHDSTLGDFGSLAPAAVTGGGCHIGAHCAIGIGATILHGVRIGAHTVVGAAALVNRDLPDRIVAYGTPARRVRARAPGERYL